MVIAYCIFAGITFTIVIRAFLKDRDAQADATALIFIAAATILWPITLPFILRKKFQANVHPQTPTRGPHSEEVSPDSESSAVRSTPQTVSATRDS